MKAIKLTTALFLVLCLFSMCKKDSKNSSNTPNQTYYVKGTLNGQAWNWQVPADGSTYVVGSSSSLGNYQGTISGGITALVSASAGFQPQLGIEFKTFNKGEDDDATTVFNNFVNTGNWAFASTLNYTVGTKSIVVYYTDNAGNQYSSTGSQSGSSFNVVTVTPVTGSVYNSDSGLKIKVTFNCKLYPVSGTGSAITITNTEATVFLDNMLLN
jgi:hypothetical protein